MARTPIIQLEGTRYGASHNSFTAIGKTGTIAAGLAANSILCAWQVPVSPPFSSDPGTAFNPFFLERVRLQWTTLTAFTTPVTAGRSLALVPLSELPTGGASGTLVDKQFFGPASSPSVVIATTGALTYAGTIPTDFYAQLPLAGSGTSGANAEKIWSWNANDVSPIALHPTDDGSGNAVPLIVGVMNPVAMDAGGTFELLVEMDGELLPNFFNIPFQF